MCYGFLLCTHTDRLTNNNASATTHRQAAVSELELYVKTLRALTQPFHHAAPQLASTRFKRIDISSAAQLLQARGEAFHEKAQQVDYCLTTDVGTEGA